MDNALWQAQNLQAIQARLAPVVALPDGVLFQKPESTNNILVYKSEGVVYLYFHADLDAEIQSRMILAEPLHLLSPYSQMVMLSLLWNQVPKRIYIIGFGGGRLPMVMHHTLPNTQIDCAEIDRDVVEVATRFFGVAKDARLKIAIQDGRRRLFEQPDHEAYDVIVVDAFVGVGSGPREFSTLEFFALCRTKLTDDGIVVINLLDNDPQHAQKRFTIVESFAHVFVVRDNDRGNEVLFGCNSADISRERLLERVAEVELGVGLSFALKPLALLLKLLPKQPVGTMASRRIEPLRDEAQAAALSFAQMAAVRLGRNDPCFCGSGKKYKKCHG